MLRKTLIAAAFIIPCLMTCSYASNPFYDQGEHNKTMRSKVEEGGVWYFAEHYPNQKEFYFGNWFGVIALNNGEIAAHDHDYVYLCGLKNEKEIFLDKGSYKELNLELAQPLRISVNMTPQQFLHALIVAGLPRKYTSKL